MRKLAFVPAVLLVFGVVALVALQKPRRLTFPAVVVRSARLAEAAPTIHARGSGLRPGMGFALAGAPYVAKRGDWAHYMVWIAPQGYRENHYDAEGVLAGAMAVDLGLGIAWVYQARSGPWFPQGVVAVYPAGAGELEAVVRAARRQFLEGNLGALQTVKAQWGCFRSAREDQQGRRKVMVVEVGCPTYSWDQCGDTLQYDIDAATGRLLGLRRYGPEDAGKPLVAEVERVEYGAPVPAEVFRLILPPGVPVLADDWSFGKGSDYAFQTPGTIQGRARVIPSPQWRVSCSETAESTAAADGDRGTCWTGRGKRHLQEPGMTVQIDFGSPTEVSALVLQHSQNRAAARENWPRAIQITATRDGTTWEQVFTGQAGPDTPAYGHFGGARKVVGIRLTLTAESDEAAWRVSEIELYGRPSRGDARWYAGSRLTPVRVGDSGRQERCRAPQAWE